MSVVNLLQPINLANGAPTVSAGSEWYLDPVHGMSQVVATRRRQDLNSEFNTNIAR